MDIDPRIAQTIVENIKGVIRHDINFFDAHGKMIASTDATRIGTFHDAARLAAERKRTVAVDGDNQFIGARNGINAPVMFGDSVVAVIGITGQRHEVEPFGIMITKMTEILIRENVGQITRFDQRMMMTNLINLLVSQHNDEDLVSYLSSTLDVDLSIPRCIVLGRCTNADADHTKRDALLNALDKRFPSGSESIFRTSARGFCILFAITDQVGSMGQLDEHHMGVLSDLQKEISHVLGRPISIGIGSMETSANQYWRSYRQATAAVEWLRFTHGARVEEYSNIGLGMLLPAMQQSISEQFVQNIFAGLDDQRIDAFQTAFNAYTRYNGSVSRAADSLFIHKNTLQNHLNAIAEQTGYNPRKLDDHTVLELAFLIRNYRSFTGEDPS